VVQPSSRRHSCRVRRIRALRYPARLKTELFPRSLIALDAAWCAAVLGNRFPGTVRTAEPRPLGSGNVASCARVALTWDPPDAGPASVVVKLAAQTRRTRFTSKLMRTYEVETAFYTRLARDLPVRTPACYFGRHDQASNTFCLVLEDLGEGSPCVELDGNSYDHVSLAIRELGRLHATSWGARLPAHPWLLRGGGGFVGDSMARLLETLLPKYLEEHGDAVGTDVADLIARFAGRVTTYGAGSELARTLVHGDFRLDNLLLSDGRLAVLDWQTVALGPPVSDVSYFLGTSVPTAARRRWESQALEDYRCELGANGVDVTAAACLRDYRRYALGGLIMAVIASTMLDRDQGHGLFIEMAKRSGQLALDVDAEAMLV
jgi:hypothetical protein